MDAKKKLLFVITEFYKGGAEVALINLFNALSPHEFDIDFVILSQRNNEGSLVNEVPKWVNVCNAGEINLKNGYSGQEIEFLLGGRAAKDFICGKKYDIAFSYGEWCRLEFVAERVDAFEKNVWIHTDIVKSTFFDEDSFFSSFLEYRYYIFVSETTRNNAVEKYPFIEKKSCVIHNVLDCQKLHMDSEAYIPDMDVNAPNRLITVANVRYEKGYLRILDVATELKRRNIPFYWNCIGKFSDATLVEQMQNEIIKRGLENQVILRGPMDNPHPYTKNSEIFVLLSDYEAWPLAMAEAMILDVPALATKTAGASEHIQDLNNGILTSYDTDEICDKIEGFFNNNSLRKSIEENLTKFKESVNSVTDFLCFVNDESRRAIMERLNFFEEEKYSAVEASIHLNRYAMVKPFCEGKRILDAACGQGYGSYLMKKWGATSVDGVDIDQNTVERADKLFGCEQIKFSCQNVENLPFPDYSFDIIVSFETIEHLEKPENFLKEIKRVLKPDGIIILSCPNDPYYYADDISNPFHKRKYTYFEFKELAEQYLGNRADYYLGFAINGFLNMPISYSTEPQMDGLVYKDSMLELFNHIECDNALCVKQESYINQWNSNYYVGIWGAKTNKKEINTVLYPRETFVEIKDEDLGLMKEIKNWETEKKELTAEIEKLYNEKNDEILALKEYYLFENEKEKVNLQQKYKVTKLELERVKMMLELCNKEKEELYVAANNNWNTLVEERKNKEHANQLFFAAQNELSIMKSTKGYKLLNLIYRIRCKLGLTK